MNKILTVIAICLCLHMNAQNEVDVLRYSFHNSFSSARSAGMAGAFGALGADMSSLNTNPAGLGLYRRGEFSFAPNFGGSSSKTTFNNETADEGDFHFKLNSIGFVSTQESDKANVKNVTFGVGYNQLANLNHDFDITGSSDNSLLDVFADQAQGIDYETIFDEGSSYSILAWDAFLIDTISGTTNQYASAISSGKSIHDIRIDRKGGVGEVVLGGAANISDRFYWGVSVALPTVNYEETITHKETPVNSDLDLESFTYTETLAVSGAGFNIKAGVILKPSQKLRLGAAIHSATVYSLTDTYSRGIKSQFDNEEIEPEDFAGTFNYRIRTPGKLMANIAVIAGKSGIISADYEYIDYSNGELKRSNLSLDTYNFTSENAAVKEVYRSTHNIKVGMEVRLAKNYRARAGARYMQSPYTDGTLSEKASAPVITYTTGLGYRNGSFFADIAGILTDRITSHYAYNSNYINEASITSRFVNIISSFGWRF